MKIIVFLLLCVIGSISMNVNSNIFEPTFQFQDRRKSFLVTCNASDITDNVLMFFYYENKNYTVPRINNNPGVYIGNFSVVKADQAKVMIMCKNVYNNDSLGSKLYFLGYPPSYIIDKYQTNLNCRDFNLMRMVCCLTPNVSAIEQLLGFEEYSNGLFQAKLYFSDYETKEMRVNDSCYQLTKQTLALTTTLHVVIENVLGKEILNFTIDRMSIQKPNVPKYILLHKNSTSFTFSVDLQDYGEYIVNMTCSSINPVRTTKNINFEMFDFKSEPVISGQWAQNSKISCNLTAKVMFGNSTVGQSSDKLSVSLTLLEGKPASGPYISPLMVDYSYITDSGTMSEIKVYFSDVLLRHRNGVITGYKWICENCYVNRRNVSNITNEISSSSRSLSLDQSTVDSVLSMTACTKIGCSDSWSRLQFRKLNDVSSDRKISIIRNRNDDNNLTVVWYGDGIQAKYLFLLICNYFPDENECNSIEKINLSTYKNVFEYFQTNRHIKTKFALLSTAPDSNEKLNWVSCFYKSLPSYDVEKKLSDFDYKKYTEIVTDCECIYCKINITVRIPSCRDFSDVYFNKISVNYSIDGVWKVQTIEFQSNQTKQFNLSGFSAGWKKYSIPIYVITISNSTIPWFTISQTTDFLSALTLFCICIAVLIIIVGIFICFCQTKKMILKKYSMESIIDRVDVFLPNNNSNPSVKLLNVDNKELFSVAHNQIPLIYNQLVGSEGHLSPEITECSTFSNPEMCSTSSTSIESTETYSSEEKLMSITCNDTLSYCSRPSSDIGKYSRIAVPSAKQIIVPESYFSVSVTASV